MMRIIFCDFGHWLNTQLQDDIAGKNYLLDIKDKHIHVHKMCRELIKAIEHDECNNAPREVRERADVALYKGKQSGRNCTILINKSLDVLM